MLTDFLNDRLKTGLVVRARDEGVSAAYVPATFWSNQIITPNSFFTFGGAHGRTGLLYELPAVGYVADPKKFRANNLWGDHPTMYGHDANACDDASSEKLNIDQYGRCTWLPSVGFDDGAHQHWECPGGIFPDNTEEKKSFIADSDKSGAGNYGCRGCAFSQRNHKLLHNGSAPLKENCQCPCNDYASCHNFAKNELRSAINEWKGSEKDDWAGYDQLSCWVEDPFAMAGIQNGLYQTRNQRGSETTYWGWNEVAVRKEIDAPDQWLTHMIYIPAWLTKRIHYKNNFDDPTMLYLRLQIKGLIDNHLVKPGKDNIGQRPGSDIVFVEEVQNGSEDSYQKHFFCMEQDLITFKVCSLAQVDDSNGKGHCYIEYAETDCKGEGEQLG